MTEKKIKWIVISVLIVVSAIGVFIYYEYDKRLKSSEEYIYNEALAKETSPYTLEDIQNSDAAYLLDPNFTVTEENCLQVLEDYFAAPARLIFLVEFPLEEDYPCKDRAYYKCDNISKNAAFGKITKNQPFTLIYDGGIWNESKIRYYFENDIGRVEFAIVFEKMCISFEEGFNSDIPIICMENDLRNEFISAFAEAMPYSMVEAFME